MSVLWNSLLNLCIILGGVGAIVSIYALLWPRLHANISKCVHDGYSAICISFEAISRYIEIESIGVPGYKIAGQLPDERGKTYGRHQLHCVLCPSDDSEFVDTIKINERLYQRDVSRDVVFVIR